MISGFSAGDVVKCRGEAHQRLTGIVEKVGRKYVHVDWGTWKKPMLPEHLVKPKYVPIPSLSNDMVSVELIQFDGEETEVSPSA